MTFELPERLPELDGFVPVPTAGFEVESVPFDPGHAFVSLRFWRVSPFTAFEPEFEQVNEAIRKALPPSFHPEPVAEAVDPALAIDSEPDGYATVVEAVTAVVFREEKDLSEAFDRCLAKFHDVVRAYRAYSQSPYHHDVTYERLPIGVLYATRTLHDEPQWSDGLSLMLLHFNAPGTAPEELSHEDLDRLSGYLSMLLRGHPLSLFAERSADSRVALVSDGEYGGAVSQTHTALEILLDGVLTLALWEEGMDPSAAASMFTEGLAKRIRTHYGQRFGGNWSTATGVFADWTVDVARMRHRVVHAGYQPTRDEARRAQETAGRVETFVQDRLGQHRTRFPRTALLVLGRPGLERLGLWAGQIEAFAARANEEPDWVDSYREWRDRLDGARF